MIAQADTLFAKLLDNRIRAAVNVDRFCDSDFSRAISNGGGTGSGASSPDKREER
jgi:hypothetical protein